MVDKLSFRDMDILVRYLFAKRNRACMLGRQMHDGPADGPQDLAGLIDAVMEQIPSDACFIITHEYMQRPEYEWWRQYYSRSAYYRRKGSALAVFLRCLNG